jgi:hypothetical protein
MQFIPSTWAVVGVDADDDGVRNPHDFDDAALAAGVYLCANHRDLSTPGGLRAAIFSYNHSDSYVDTVIRLARGYASGDVSVVPNDGPPATDPGDGGAGDNGDPSAGGHVGHEHGVIVRHHPDHQPGGGSPGDPGPGDPGPGDPGPGDPGPGTEPDPVPTALTGFVASCAKDPTAWCIGDAPLDFGDNADLSQPQEDYDADGVVEPVVDELAGLATVRVRVELDEDRVVHTIRGLPYAVVEMADPTTTDPTTAIPTTTTTTTDPTTTDPTATATD